MAVELLSFDKVPTYDFLKQKIINLVNTVPRFHSPPPGNGTNFDSQKTDPLINSLPPTQTQTNQTAFLLGRWVGGRGGVSNK